MILNYVLIGVAVAIFVAFGTLEIILPKCVLQWVGSVLLPLIFWPVGRLNKLLGFESDSYKPSEPTARQIVLARIWGILHILMALIFLAATLGFFK